MGVSLEVGENEIVCLIGSNGAGKTTLLRAISGIVKCWAGTIEFNGEDLRALPAYDFITRGIAHVPEGRRLFGTMSVRDNLLMGAYRAQDNAAVRGDLERVFACFRSWPSAASRPPARCLAVSSRCARSAAR